jgi:hypothetical protein
MNDITALTLIFHKHNKYMAICFIIMSKIKLNRFYQKINEFCYKLKYMSFSVCASQCLLWLFRKFFPFLWIWWLFQII